MSDNSNPIGKAILIEVVIALRNGCRERGADLSSLTNEAIQSASWKQLRDWKTDLDHLIRTVSSGKS